MRCQQPNHVLRLTFGRWGRDAVVMRAAWAIFTLLPSLCAMGCKGGKGRPLAPSASNEAPAVAATPAVAKRKSARAAVPWPDWPTTPEQATEAIARATRRPTGPAAPPPRRAAQVLASLIAALPRAELHAGWRQIALRLRREAGAARAGGVPLWLMVGTYHDAPVQIEAFRRLVGPLGVNAADLVLEQFDASGAWGGLARHEQQGDESFLAGYLRGGGRDALEAIWARQRLGNYTGWKYGYLPQVIDVLMQGRAAGKQVWACDMPRAMQRRLPAPFSDAQRLRLRELHCFCSLRAHGVSGGVRMRAMLWGQDHVGQSGFARYLPASDKVIALYVFGGRHSEVALERRLAARLALAAPLLVAQRSEDAAPNHERWLLLLPGRALGARVERKREKSGEAQKLQLRLRAPRGARLLLGKRQLVVDKETLALTLDASERVFAVEQGRQLLVGSLDLAREGELSLDIVPKRRQIELHLKASP